MRSLAGVSLLASLTAAAAGAERPLEAAAAPIHHSLVVTLDPDARRLGATDEIRLPAGEHEFLLNAALRVTAAEPALVELSRGGESHAFLGGNSATPLAPVKRYRVSLPAPGTLRLSCEGPFDFGLSDEKEQYARGFRETAGVVSREGVYLAGASYWYPQFGTALVTFDVEVRQPEGWHVVAAGEGRSRDADGRARWASHAAVDEIVVCGGPLVPYRRAAGAVEALAYLRQKDDALAAKYLEATAQYLELYRGLIGPYPYGKFALVENFWETGYGMPSFTLLGSQVIRLPFILTSSYPHEILHNWWGNSVFVDYGSGNWSEGLTAYLADHLLAEQRGRGAEYRRDALQKYRSYVRAGRDFPLAEFRSRHSAATEAVGYGKALMLFHMLRQRVGDEAFRAWLGRFYGEQRGRRASFGDLLRTLSPAAADGEDLDRLFADHVNREGAARLSVSLSDLRDSTEDGYDVSFVLEQTQPGAPLRLDVPVVVQTTGEPVRSIVHMTGRLAASTVRTAAEPVALHVDPDCDVFRLLDPRELPPSLGQVFGDGRPLAVLPSAATQAEQDAYRRLVESWRSDSHAPEIASDSEVRELPRGRAVWLLGRSNALAPRLPSSADGFEITSDRLAVGAETFPLQDRSVVIVRRHPSDDDSAVAWVFSDRLAALPGLARKLPHYGKYSYLAFEGDEPSNVLKGQWATPDSPLRIDLRPQSERSVPAAALALPARKALAELPAVFSEARLLEHVRWLAAPEREGRGVGTPGLEAAADYVAKAFAAAGLEPGGGGGTFFQSFTSDRSPSGTPVALRNVIGVLRGRNPAWRDQAVLVTAHYDHLGRGWPDAHQGDAGRIHPGADDNASGVAVLIELARALAAGSRPERSLVFAAFTGEEAGLLGSRHYVSQPAVPIAKTMAALNLDTVGRLRQGALLVLAGGTATEWPHIFRGVSHVTGVATQLVPDAIEASDQRSFVESGVPAVQLFSGPTADYHRPTDTANHVDGPGLVKVAVVAKEVLDYLGARAEPLTATIVASPAKARDAVDGPAVAPLTADPQGTPRMPRRVSFGTQPDFEWRGPGVRVSAVVAGSPAEKAGVRAGDVLRRIEGRDLADLRAFSEMLRTLTAGQTVRAVVERDGRELTIEVTVAER